MKPIEIGCTALVLPQPDRAIAHLEGTAVVVSSKCACFSNTWGVRTPLAILPRCVHEKYLMRLDDPDQHVEEQEDSKAAPVVVETT